MTHNVLPTRFRNLKERLQDQVALRKKEYGLWHDLSWNEYYAMAKKVGSALVSMGLEKGQCVSIIGDNCVEWVVADLGIQCVGGVSVGVYATNAAPQVQYVVEHSDSTFFFVENEEQLDKWLAFRDKVPLLKKIIVWDLEGLREFKDPMVMSFNGLLELGEKVIQEQPDLFDKKIDEVHSDDLSVLIYTSGTTGPPKGVMLTHANVTWMVNALMVDVITMNPSDEIMSFLPLCHIFERLFSVFGHIEIGYIVNFIESPDTVADNLREISPTIGYGVPRIWEKYASSIYIRMGEADWFKKLVYHIGYKIGQKRSSLKTNHNKVPILLDLGYWFFYFIIFRKLKKRLGFERMRIAISAAAPISKDVLLFFQSIGVDFIEAYGQTECTGAATVCRPGEVKFGTVGPVVKGVDVKIADDGEILIKSPGVMKGYFKNPESTAKTVVDEWLHSGDVGELDEDGYLTITDRKKDIIVTVGGKNITPQYIENKLKASTYINDAIVIGDKRKYLTCLIMLDEDTVVKYAQDNKIQFSTYKDLSQAPEINALIKEELDKVNRTLSQVEQPKKFTILPKRLYVEDGEVTPTMKVKRSSINEAFSDLIEAMY